MARVLAIFGPTAAGKSALAHAAARALGGEIVVADPFQRYRGLEVAADAPRAHDTIQVPYHLVGDLDLTEASTAAQFAQHAHEVVDGILARGRVPVVTGGTGLYLRAALTEMGFPEPPPPGVRDWAEALVAADPVAARGELARRDPDAAHRVDTANPRRLARALEVAACGGDGGGARLWDGSMRHPTLLVAVTRERPVLDRLIATRVQRELADGLLDELGRAIDTPGVRREPLQIIGAKEVAAMRRGEVAPEAMAELLAARTRRLARRQLQWLRRWPEAVELPLGVAPAGDALPALLALWRERLP